MKKRLLAAVAATAFAVSTVSAPAAAITVSECKADANALLNTPGSPYYQYRFLAQWSPGLWDWVLTRSCIRVGATPG
jgi:hypothetical protein